MYVSDIVLLGKLTEEQLKDEDLLTGCVAGALHKDEYLTNLEQAGFRVNVLSEDKEKSKTQYNELPIESIKIEATKL
jgi:arsenite methyltransferase